MILEHDPDVILIQETWLMNSNKNSTLRNINNNYLADGVSAVPDNELLRGGPYGGLGIMWRKSMVDIIDFKLIPNTNRACAIEIKYGDDKILCVNSYMPVDNQRKSYVDSVFLETIDCIELFIESTGLFRVIMGGDMNLDYSRHNAHDRYFLEFLDRHNFVYTFDLPIADKGYTYFDMSLNCKSCIDHFNVHNSLCDSVLGVQRCEHALNPSKHLPVLLTVCVSTERRELDDEEDGHRDVPICWYRVNENHIRLYQMKQEQLLAGVGDYDVDQCVDVNCKNEEHRYQINEWCERLIECCLGADDVFPHIKKKRNRPNWKEEVRPFKDDSIWWFNLWVQYGRPGEGIIFENMRESKRQLAYANRRNKRRQTQARTEKMAEAIVQNRSRDFFHEVRKLKPKDSTAPSIDGHIDPKKIADHFADKYEDLYNSVPPAAEGMEKINEFIRRNCHHCDEVDRVISVEEVEEAIEHLKPGKSDGDKGFMSNHLQLSCDSLIASLARLITAIITHGYQPKGVLTGTISSIPKDSRGNICSGKNYRGIALCCSIAKVIDLVMLVKYSHLLNTSEMQFAFKKNHSTTMCSLVLKEVINYYVNNDSTVYTCFIDETKAFDRIRYDKLFQILIYRDLPAVIVRAMLDLYQRQVVRTVWRGHHSRSFTVSNGIRQGGIISPILFCVYMDELLKRLENEDIGCHIGRHFYGALGYADDLSLVVPSVTGMRRMLAICDEYGEEYSVEYNPIKTVCVAFSRRKVRVKPDIYLSGQKLRWVDSVKHLGNHLGANLSESKEITMKKSDLIQRVNTLIVTLGKSSDAVIARVLNSQCCHFYGAQAWNFNDKAVEEFQTTWNRCIRRVFKLPYATHRRYLPALIGTCTALDQIYGRFMKLEMKMESGENERVSFLAKFCSDHARSIIGGNIRRIAKRLNVEWYDAKRCARGMLRHAYASELTETDHTMISLVKELRQCLSGECHIEGFSYEDIECVLYDVCVD